MNKKKVLLLRLDKIGDLVCTLPVDQVLDENLYDITWVVQKGLGQVVDLGEKKRTYLELDKSNPKESASILNKFITSQNFDIAISFQCPWWVNFELFKARIPVRAGVLSQWHSFLFLNKGLRQKRSKAEQHEFDYNLDLVKNTFDKVNISDSLVYFKIPTENSNDVLNKFNLKATKYIVVHPGMMGSALNWPQAEYINCINNLIAENKLVVITGTAADEPYLTDIKKAFAQHEQVLWLQSKANFKELTAILANAEFVIAPSTGVAHLTASTGNLIKGIYSPVQVHHPKRWAPRGPLVEIYFIEDKTEKVLVR